MTFRNLSGTAGLFYSSQEHCFLGHFLFFGKAKKTTFRFLLFEMPSPSPSRGERIGFCQAFHSKRILPALLLSFLPSAD